MKDITLERRSKAISKYYEDGGFRYQLGDSHFIIPPDVCYELEKKMHYYEIDTIHEIIENYDTLSKSLKVPLIYEAWLTKALRSGISLDDEESICIRSEVFEKDDLEKQILSGISSRPNWLSFNASFLGNVTVGNFTFTERRTFKLCEFDIEDRQGEIIRAVLNYHSVPYNSIEDKAKEQLKQMVNSSPIDYFDVTFTAMPQVYWIGTKKKTREKKLHIIDIHKRKTESDEPEDIPVDVTSLSPVLVG